MTTTLPADPETERLALKVAKARGQPLSTVVRDAIEASARQAGVLVEDHGHLTVAEKRRRFLEIAQRSAARPILDPRPADEFLGYDRP